MNPFIYAPFIAKPPFGKRLFIIEFVRIYGQAEKAPKGKPGLLGAFI
jgi:hypothetical protein